MSLPELLHSGDRRTGSGLETACCSWGGLGWGPHPFPELRAWSPWGPGKYLLSELISNQRKPL